IDQFARAEGGELAEERKLLAQSIEHLQAILQPMVETLVKSDPRTEGGDLKNLYKVGQNTSRLLLCAGDVIVGWLLMRQAEVALEALGKDGVSAADKSF